MKTTIAFGLLTVEVTILVADLRNSENNRFRIESVTDENGSKAEMSDEIMDSFEIYLEALLPALINPLRTVRVRYNGMSSAIDTNEVTDVVAARIMEDMGWPAEKCEVVEEEAGFGAAVKRYNEAVDSLNKMQETDYSKEFDSAAEYWAHCCGDEIACLPPKDYKPVEGSVHPQRAPRMQHDNWMDGEIGLTLTSMGINL